eukprot:scaffold49924_cov59-Attheya_sp.AAC.3
MCVFGDQVGAIVRVRKGPGAPWWAFPSKALHNGSATMWGNVFPMELAPEQHLYHDLGSNENDSTRQFSLKRTAIKLVPELCLTVVDQVGHPIPTWARNTQIREINSHSQYQMAFRKRFDPALLNVSELPRLE